MGQCRDGGRAAWGGRQGSAGTVAGQHGEGGRAARGGRVCSVRGRSEGRAPGWRGWLEHTGTETQKLFPQHFTECSGMDMGHRPVSPSPHASPHGFPTTPVNSPRAETAQFLSLSLHNLHFSTRLNTQTTSSGGTSKCPQPHGHSGNPRGHARAPLPSKRAASHPAVPPATKTGGFPTFRRNIKQLKNTLFTNTYFIFFCKPTVGVGLLFLKVGLKILHFD